MRYAVQKFFGDIRRLFSGRNLVWHAAAIVATYFLVTSGFDAMIVKVFHGTTVQHFAFMAGFIGFYMPIAVPAVMVGLAAARRSPALLRNALLIAQAEITGLLLSFFYKAVTGRPGPTELHGLGAVSPDLSHVFNFGILRNGVFWGWPSSHVTVAFAGMLTLAFLYWRKRPIRYAAVLYALAMALAVSITFHWFSDVVAGMLFGFLVAITITASYRAAHPVHTKQHA